LFFERFVGILLFVLVGCTASAAGELHPGSGEFGTWKWVFRFCLFLVLNFCYISTDAAVAASQPASQPASSLLDILTFFCDCFWCAHLLQQQPGEKTDAQVSILVEETTRMEDKDLREWGSV